MIDEARIGSLNQLKIQTKDTVNRGLVLSSEEKNENIFFSLNKWYKNVGICIDTVSSEEYENLKQEMKCAQVPALYEAISSFKKDNPFIYHFLSRINVSYSANIDTGVTYYDPYVKEFVIKVNPVFCSVLAYLSNQRVLDMLRFLLYHEALHILWSHTKEEVTEEDIKHHDIKNVIQDLVINKYLKKELRIEPAIGVNDFVEVSGKIKEGVSFQKVIEKAQKLGLLKKACVMVDNSELDGHYVLGFYWGEKYKSGIDKVFVRDLLKLYEFMFEEKDSKNDQEHTIIGIEASEESVKELSKLLDEVNNEKGTGCGDGYSLLGVLASSIKRPAGYQNTTVQEWRVRLRSFLLKGLSSEEKYLINAPSARIEGQFGRDIDVRKPRSIRFSFDVSGSMSINDYMFCLSEVDAVIKAIRIKRIKVTVVWWGSSIQVEEFRSYREFKERCKESTPSLGGTNINMLLKFLDSSKRADIDIICTDGLFQDTDKHRVDAVWCVTPDGCVEHIKNTRKERIVQPK